MVNPYESPNTESSNGTLGVTRPVWVSIGLWGLPNRMSAIAFMWLSLALAGTGIVLSPWIPRAAVSVVFLVSAWWYWAAIRWVDDNGGWHSSSVPSHDDRQGAEAQSETTLKADR
jgi:hypothetical protein